MDPAGPPFLIGIGASAGGVESLLELAGRLDPALPATVLVVLHQSPSGPTVFPELMARRCRLPVRHARHGEQLPVGEVRVAPPDHHLLVVDGQLEVVRGPRENGHRPAIDPLFRSIAQAAGPAGVGCVLTGLLDDGAAGLLDVVRHGGTAVVQDPAEATFDSMPRAALEQVPGAVVRPLSEIGAVFSQLTSRPTLGGHRPSSRLAREIDAVRRAPGTFGAGPPGPAAGLACPDCSGPLYDLSEDRMLRYRCRIGHAWSERSLSHEQDTGIERVLATALQALEDKADLQHRIATTAAERGSDLVAARAREAAHAAVVSAKMVRELLTSEEDEGTA
ncbi:chemotaxis protein CheB [Actinomycetospora cinnamomea]|uniref:protein-glutamate methylesterase n=1 Tax=Actinomycetospora cinnamomea TaxID=663609 RepID=A0A2U1FLK8_9PSEU|nr:chemotaxis protein CheB [Actinomycetospora cinnamomea]PVZ13058.1 two-component system chemotaxis response regulator CheB [Actinomycetospora cinnamomea]